MFDVMVKPEPAVSDIFWVRRVEHRVGDAEGQGGDDERDEACGRYLPHSPQRLLHRFFVLNSHAFWFSSH